MFDLRNQIPLATVMIQAKTPERAIELIEKGLAQGADAFGIELERFDLKYHTPDVFREVFESAQGKPLYITNYRHSSNEGLSDEEIAEKTLMAAECGGDLYDLMGDFYCKTVDEITYDPEAVAKQKQLIETLHGMGKQILMSSHTMRYMPYDEVSRIVNAHKSRGADIAKIVTSAGNNYECNMNLGTTARLANELGHPFLFLCGGDACRLHRRLGPMIAGGLFLCVVEYDDMATPTQPMLREVKEILHSVYQF